MTWAVRRPVKSGRLPSALLAVGVYFRCISCRRVDMVGGVDGDRSYTLGVGFLTGFLVLIPVPTVGLTCSYYLLVAYLTGQMRGSNVW